MIQEISVSKGKQVFPRIPNDFIGKIVEGDNDLFSAIVISCCNDQTDTLHGQALRNPRLNKFWGAKIPTGEWVCICIDWFHPEDIKGIKFYEPIWSIVQTDVSKQTAGVRQKGGDGQAVQDHAPFHAEEEAHR